MNMNEYQRRARQTRLQVDGMTDPLMIPLLGLAGEAGELLNEYKKRLRDGDAHVAFEQRLVEELGDVLWYIAEVASVAEVRLEAIAEANLQKTQERFGSRSGPIPLGPHRQFDAGYPADQRLPRRFTADFRQDDDGVTAQITVNDEPLGQPLTDNAHGADGYRFHDVFHLACVAILGWSPVTRRNLRYCPGKKKHLGLKRKSDLRVDEVEDGGRAIVTEEGVSALVFAHWTHAQRFEGLEATSYELLKAIKIMTAGLEVSVCTTGEWEATILTAYDVWQQLLERGGGRVEGDADNRTFVFVPES